VDSSHAVYNYYGNNSACEHYPLSTINYETINYETTLPFSNCLDMVEYAIFCNYSVVILLSIPGQILIKPHRCTRRLALFMFMEIKKQQRTTQ
jgi:hypothetical protein